MEIDFNKNKDGLVPVIIQNYLTEQVLMLGYMNPEAYSKTKEEGKVTFFSRSKNRLWTKGETSGNFLEVKEILLDCDQDTLLIKVKPNGIPDDVPKEKTISQIAASLNEVGQFAKDYGQLVRVEVHGELTQEIPNMYAIFEQVTEKNVKMCWNCNDQDLLPPGLESNFNSVKKWFGDTVHVREFNVGEYPYQQLINLFTGIKYDGWILLEARTEPADKIDAMKEQLSLFNSMISKAQKG